VQAAAHDPHRGGVLARQLLRGDGGHRACAQRRDRADVDQGQGLAVGQ